MPNLSGAEFKILCYIARRTFGFHRDAATISLTQICSGLVIAGQRKDCGTGLSRSTAASSLASLEKQGYIVAHRPSNRIDSNTYAILVEDEESDQEGSSKIEPPPGPKTQPASAEIEPLTGPKIEPPPSSEIEPLIRKRNKDLKERSSSSSEGVRTKTSAGTNQAFTEIVREWATSRGIVRLRSDGAIGAPDEPICSRWSAALPPSLSDQDVHAILDQAASSASRLGDWNSWTYLTLQVCKAAERHIPIQMDPVASGAQSRSHSTNDDPEPESEWKAIKAQLAEALSPEGYANWIAPSRQLYRDGNTLTVSVQDEVARLWMTTEYASVVRRIMAPFQLEVLYVTV